MTVWGSKESLCPAPPGVSLKPQLWSLSLQPGLEKSPQSGGTCLLLCLFPGRAHSDRYSGQRAIPCQGRDGGGGEEAAHVQTGKGFHETGVWRVHGDDRQKSSLEFIQG